MRQDFGIQVFRPLVLALLCTCAPAISEPAARIIWEVPENLRGSYAPLELRSAVTQWAAVTLETDPGDLETWLDTCETGRRIAINAFANYEQKMTGRLRRSTAVSALFVSTAIGSNAWASQDPQFLSITLGILTTLSAAAVTSNTITQFQESAESDQLMMLRARAQDPIHQDTRQILRNTKVWPPNQTWDSGLGTIGTPFVNWQTQDVDKFMAYWEQTAEAKVLLKESRRSGILPMTIYWCGLASGVAGLLWIEDHRNAGITLATVGSASALWGYHATKQVQSKIRFRIRASMERYSRQVAAQGYLEMPVP